MTFLKVLVRQNVAHFVGRRYLSAKVGSENNVRSWPQ